MCEVGSEKRMSPRGSGGVGVYRSWANAAVAMKRIAAMIDLVIRSTPSNPIPHELRLRGGEVRAALRHAVAGDAGAGDLAVKIRVVRVTRRDAKELRHLDARDANGVRVGAAGGE